MGEQSGLDEQQQLHVHAMAAFDPKQPLAPFHFKLRSPRPKDVLIKILFCGVCHSDLHQIRDDWKISTYPLVAGHEIVGTVAQVGAEVKRFKPGDRAGVGCMVGSCRQCPGCEQELEQYCDKVVYTYNSRLPDGTVTYGGYATHIVVDESFVLSIPESLPLEAAAPLLCAGITVYSPMAFFGMNQAGKHLGVVGLGGLGHMAVKFGKAFGVKVTVISTSPNKEKEAKERLGADSFLVSKDEEQMKRAAGSMDYIVNTVSAEHSVVSLLALLKLNGRIVLVGAPPEPFPVRAFALIQGRKSISGSAIGSVKETQEMLDFCGKNNVTADIELLGLKDVNVAMDRLAKSDVKYRFVLDVSKL